MVARPRKRAESTCALVARASVSTVDRPPSKARAALFGAYRRIASIAGSSSSSGSSLDFAIAKLLARPAPSRCDSPAHSNRRGHSSEILMKQRK